MTERKKLHIIQDNVEELSLSLRIERVRGAPGAVAPFFTRKSRKEALDMAKEYKLSPERFKELQDELVYLKTVREKEGADQIKEARSFGDLSENSEYDEAKNEQGKLYSRMAEVENILQNCVVIEEEEGGDHNTVRLGSRITVLDKEFNEEEVYEVVGSQEADPMNGRISEDSPFGKALLGKAIGDDVVVEAPVGMLRYQIVNIQKA